MWATYLRLAAVVTTVAALVSTAIPVVAAPPCTWTGRWETNWGRMDLQQSGDQVTGTYVRQQGKMLGRAAGNALSGTWTEGPTYRPPTDAGDYEFVMAPGCNAFNGRWRYTGKSDWRPWTGKRMATR